MQQIRSLLKVGDGRGFVVEETMVSRRRYVITAAHCLPVGFLAPGFRADWDETFPELLGPVGAEPTVWAECVFVDPIADIAVLGEPNSQALFDHAAAYQELTEVGTPLRIGDAPALDQVVSARLIGLELQTIECTVRHNGANFWIDGASSGIRGGMSGSPILDRTGAAIGVVSQSHGKGGQDGEPDEPHSTGASPRLAINLPGWLLVSLGAAELVVDAARHQAAYEQNMHASRLRR